MRHRDAGVVIVGAGEAGAGVAFALRQSRFEGEVTLIGEEPHPPYRRPPLSKGFLTGEVSEQALAFRGPAAYERARIRTLFDRQVQRIDRALCTVRLNDGTDVPYEHLVLATGGRARRLSLPGAEHSRLHYVRTIADVQRLREHFLPGSEILILGGGFIGLEIASVGVTHGLKVTLVEALPRLLARVSTPVISDFYASSHRRRGVQIKTGLSARCFEDRGSQLAVRFDDDSQLCADVVIAGVGMIPNTDLAQAAGLAVENGIVVDSQLVSSDPRIFAVGDCANYLNPQLGTRVRLESVPNAAEHARICAAAITGESPPPQAVPWFWSDQYDLKLQIAGLSRGFDECAIRGDPATESFCAYYLRKGVVICADAINRPSDFSIAKKLISGQIRASIEQLQDESFSLASLLTP